MTKEDSAFLRRCREIPTSTWADALDKHSINGVISDLPRRAGSERCVGYALTILERAEPHGSFELKDFAVGSILEAAGPSSFLMIAMGGVAISTMGGLACRAAKAAGAVGAAIDGGCRDVDEIEAMNFWLASRHVTPLTGKLRVKVESIGAPITMSGVTVSQDDLVIADQTGIVVVPKSKIEAVFAEAERIDKIDIQIGREIESGATFKAATDRAGHM